MFFALQFLRYIDEIEYNSHTDYTLDIRTIANSSLCIEFAQLLSVLLNGITINLVAEWLRRFTIENAFSNAI